MQAAVYHAPGDLRLESIPIPKPAAGELLIKVLSASICGTDLRILHGQHRMIPPGATRIPGHELVGTIARLGEGVQEYQEGQRVFVAPNWGCGRCKQCLSGKNNLCAQYQAIGITCHGAFAEYLLVPAAAVVQGNVIPVSEDADPATLALVEPLACVWHGQEALQIQAGETVLIMGAGPIGLMHLLLARLRGAGRILVSEPRRERLEQALRLGADRAIQPQQEDLSTVIAETTQGQGVDVVIVAAPVHTLMEQAIHLVGTGGRINLFAGLPRENPLIQVDANRIHYKEIHLTGTTACSTEDCRQAMALVERKWIDLSPLISHRFLLKQVNQAFELAESGNALKVVLQT